MGGWSNQRVDCDWRSCALLVVLELTCNFGRVAKSRLPSLGRASASRLMAALFFHFPTPH